MGNAPIDYAPPDGAPAVRRWLGRAWVPLLTVSALLLSAWVWIEREDDTYIDPVPGSMMRVRTHPLGIRFGPTLEVAPLAQRLEAMGVRRTPRWRLLSSRRRTLPGSMSRACGPSPAIYAFLPAQQRFVDRANDAEVLAFVNAMESGTADQQRTAVFEAWDRTLADDLTPGTGE